MKKITVLALVLIVLLAMLTVVSCDDGTEPATQSPSGTTGTPETVPAEPAEKPWPTRKLNDATLKILGRNFCHTDFTATELLDEAINDGVYERNNWLKENYGFTIELTIAANDNEWATSAKNANQAGTGDYNFFVGGGKFLSVVAQENGLIDLTKEENIDLSAEWWDQSATRDLSIANRVFITTGALNTSDIASTYAIFVNKTTLESKENFENPYQLVYDKKWTMAKMLAMSKDYASDLNGDGKKDFSDAYGYVCEQFDSYAIFFSSGETIVSKDENDLPVLSIYTPRAVEFISTLKEFYSDESVLVSRSKNIVPINQDGRAVFCGTTLYAMPKYRAMEDEFGILPMPMYEEGQENYVHAVSTATTGSLVGIPTCTENTDEATYMVELLCRKSLTTLHEDYLVTTVTYNSLRDEDSYKMLDIIIDSRVFDVAYVNDWGGWMMWLYGISYDPASADKFTSQYDSVKEKTETDIKTTVDAYKANF